MSPVGPRFRTCEQQLMIAALQYIIAVLQPLSLHYNHDRRTVPVTTPLKEKVKGKEYLQAPR